MSSNTRQKQWTFLNAANALGNGELLHVNSKMMTATIEITGTGTSTVIFEGKSSSNGTFYPIMAVKLSDFSTASSVSDKGVIYQLSLEGLIDFRVRVSSYTNGTVTVKGTVVD